MPAVTFVADLSQNRSISHFLKLTFCKIVSMISCVTHNLYNNNNNNYSYYYYYFRLVTSIE